MTQARRRSTPPAPVGANHNPVGDVLAYLASWSAAPGDAVAVRAHAPGRTVQLGLARLDHPEGHREPIADCGYFKGRAQHVDPGSYIQVESSEHLRSLSAFSVRLWMWSTRPMSGALQSLMALGDPATGQGFVLGLSEDGRLRFEVGGHAVVTATRPVRGRVWIEVLAACDPGSGLLLAIRKADSRGPPEAYRFSSAAALAPGAPGPLTIAVRLKARLGGPDKTIEPYDGKIEQPVLADQALTVARWRSRWPRDHEPGQGWDDDPTVVGAWDFGADPASFTVADRSGHDLGGTLVNAPGQAMTGHRWTWRDADRPASHVCNAIYFHSDDLADAGWDDDAVVHVPAELPSGVYAVELHTDREESVRLPLFVSPNCNALDRSAIVVVLPTLTYLAYANHRPRALTPGDSQTNDVHNAVGMHAPDDAHEADRCLARHSELGASLYNYHPDGSGIARSSRLRPVLNLVADYRWWGTRAPRHFSADLMLLRWLRREGVACDLITDEDLHREGPELLSRYRVAITGSHPEYVTARMLEALEDHVHQGRHLLYLGGNGFYWVTTVHPDLPGMIEVRRGWAGSRDWESAVGEERHASTGEFGGLWRHRGLPPQALVGVGFAAMGWGSPAAYRRLPDSWRDDVAPLFAGVDDDPFGGFPDSPDAIFRGAVGDEIDRADAVLSGDLEVLRLATSQGLHEGQHQRAVEDVRQHTPDLGRPDDPDLRADVVLARHDGGGQVFSVGSMNWIPCLGHPGPGNPIATITRNVLRAFATP